MTKTKIIMRVFKEGDQYHAYAMVRGISIDLRNASLTEVKEAISEALSLAFEEEGVSYDMHEMLCA
jgi:hypothetical protein